MYASKVQDSHALSLRGLFMKVIESVMADLNVFEGSEAGPWVAPS